MIKEKKLVLILLVLSVGCYLIVKMIWGGCPQTNCSESFIDNYLSPIKPAALILSGFFCVFLILPTHYFISWLKWIFSWAFPLSIILVITIEDNGSILSFSRALVAQLLGMFFGILSVLFVLSRFYWVHRKSRMSIEKEIVK